MSPKTLFLSLGIILSCACAQQTAPAPSSLPAPARTAPLVMPLSTGVDQSLRIKVQPDADLAVWILEPAAATPIRGTVLFIHGFGTAHDSISVAAEALRKAGYRAIMVDMRGFGDSTGVHSDFGVTDAQDMKQLIDALQAKGLCGPTLGVFGTSLGAATAILYAADDPRVVAVVAVAPFADIRSEVPNYARGLLGSVVGKVDDQDINRLADVVSKAVKWNLDNARPLDAITKTKAQILLIHSDTDEYIPHAASEELHAAAPDHSVLLTPHDRSHVQLCFDVPGELHAVTRDWFDHYLMPRDGGQP